MLVAPTERARPTRLKERRHCPESWGSREDSPEDGISQTGSASLRMAIYRGGVAS
jgi:hypothetical protein